MRIYFTIIYNYFAISLKKSSTYRLNFFLTLVDSLCWFSITILLYESIFSSLLLENGVTKNQIFLIVGISELIKSILFTLFIDNLPSITKQIRYGTLDKFILYPIDTQFMLSFQNINFANLISIVPSIILIGISVDKTNTLSILLFIVSIIFSIILAYSIWYIIMTMSIWFTKIDGIHESFLSLLTITQYPQQLIVNKYTPKITFIFLPVLLISNIPAQILNNGINLFLILTVFLFALIFLLVSRFFWKFALNYYTSTN